MVVFDDDIYYKDCFYCFFVGDVKRKSFGDKPSVTAPNFKPKFPSLRKKPTTGSSTTALIFENRPRYEANIRKNEISGCLHELVILTNSRLDHCGDLD